MKNKLTNLLKENNTLIADGAMGTNLMNFGLESGTPPEIWNIEKPELIKKIHSSFISAGSNIILTNSFGGNSSRLSLHKLKDKINEININAVKIAKETIKNFKDIIIAGSIGPTGEMIKPIGNLTFEDTKKIFYEQIKLLAYGGVDLIWIETMSSIEETKAAIISAKKVNLPIVCTMSFDSFGNTMMGVSPKEFQNLAYNFELDAFGANCGIGPSELINTILKFKQSETYKIPIVSKVNCGIPKFSNGKIEYTVNPELMAKYAVLARDSGANIIGGCCGTSAEHIKAMVSAIKINPANPKPDFKKISEVLGKPWKEVLVNRKSKRILKTKRKRRKK